jgi:hypothetical protein
MGIIHVSPEDATDLINERDTGCYKLAGTALGHFGVFSIRLASERYYVGPPGWPNA